MKKYQIALLTGAALSLSLTSQAAPAKPGLRTYLQPDGTEVQLEKIGDEHAHIFMTAQGQPVVETKGGFFYAQPSVALSGVPGSTNLMVGRDEAPAVDNNLVFEQLNGQRAMRQNKMIDSRNGMMRAPSAETIKHCSMPSVGNQRTLVILVEYSDVKFKTPNAAEYFDRFFHEEGFSDYGGTGCVRDYFQQSSHGIYNPEFDVYGPVTLTNNRAYYGGNDAYGNDKKPHMMAVEAVRILDPEVDFSVYDTNGDGYVDNVSIIYAGQGEADSGSSDTVWPHQWLIESAAGVSFSVDGVSLDAYNCINEWGDVKPNGIGTFCHEFSHVLGLPDVYATDYGDATNMTPGEWDVMDHGSYNNDGCTPPMHSAFEAYTLGWCFPEVVTDAYSGALESSSGQAMLINAGNAYPNEFFIFESRKKEGFDKYLPGEGMLVWHIDYKQSVWDNNTVNNKLKHMRINLVEADGRKGPTSLRGDAFNETTPEFSYDSAPAYFSNWAGQDLGLPLTGIHQSTDMSTTYFKVKGGVAEPNAVNLAYDETGKQLSWDNSAEATAYELRIYNVTRKGWEPTSRLMKVGAGESRAGAVDFVPQGLRKGDTYSAQVRVVGAASRSEWSDPVEFVATDGNQGEVGIDTVVSDDVNAPVMYYDLRGIRVLHPENGHFYIERRGKTVRKAIFQD